MEKKDEVIISTKEILYDLDLVCEDLFGFDLIDLTSYSQAYLLIKEHENRKSKKGILKVKQFIEFKRIVHLKTENLWQRLKALD